MARNVAQKLIASHLVEGDLTPGSEVGLRVDQTLTQDATGTMVMLELEAMGLDRVRTELSVQYVDHNLLQTDEKNPDDHLFLQSRSEEHTSELQSRGHLVCRLLLEKKKKKQSSCLHHDKDKRIK